MRIQLQDARIGWQFHDDGLGRLCLWLQVTRKLLIACSLSFAFMIVEVVGGYFAGRCASCGHLADTVLSLGAMLLVTRPSHDSHCICGLRSVGLFAKILCNSVRKS